MPKLCKECGINAMACLCTKSDPICLKCTTWPLKSEALGVLPNQVKEASEEAAKLGVPTEFTASGEAIFTSRKHRKEFCERHGYYDRDGGYSDPQRGVYDRKYKDMEK